MSEVITTESAPAAVGPYSQAVRYGDLLFVSGQIPLDPDTGEIVAGDIEVQTKRVLDNLEAIIKAGGMELRHVLKCTCFLADIEDFAKFNSVYNTYFEEVLPARETVEVSRLPKDVAVEISAICGR